MTKKKKQFEYMTSSEKLVELETQKKSSKKWSFFNKLCIAATSGWLAIVIAGIVLGVTVGILPIVGALGLPLGLTILGVSYINEFKEEKEKIDEQISQVELEQNAELKREMAPKSTKISETNKTTTTVKAAVIEKGIEQEN